MVIGILDKVVLRDGTVGFVYALRDQEIEIKPIDKNCWVSVWVDRNEVVQVNPPVIGF